MTRSDGSATVSTHASIVEGANAPNLWAILGFSRPDRQSPIFCKGCPRFEHERRLRACSDCGLGSGVADSTRGPDIPSWVQRRRPSIGVMSDPNGEPREHWFRTLDSAQRSSPLPSTTWSSLPGDVGLFRAPRGLGATTVRAVRSARATHHGASPPRSHCRSARAPVLRGRGNPPRAGLPPAPQPVREGPLPSSPR